MPARNSIKQYVVNGYYHIYNRGVEKRIIFEDQQDYAVFLSYLKTYLTPKDIPHLQKELSEANTAINRSSILRQLHLNNFSDEIKLLAYCLMPNHFHMLVKQTSSDSIDNFINSLNTRYVMYFNRKYKRIGPLFQGVYKAVLVKTDEQLLYLSAYIHKNPSKLLRVIDRGNFNLLLSQPSSLSDYIGRTNTVWIDRKNILSSFSKTKKRMSYKHFVLGYTQYNSEITDLVID